LKECFQSLTTSATETFGDAWNGLVGRLGEDERKEAEERLLGLGLIAGQGILVERSSSNAASADKLLDQTETLGHLKEMFAVLPERIKASVSGQVFAEILGESSGLSASAAKIAAQPTAVDSDAQGAIFYAFGLMLNHQPEKALDLLNRIPVPESLGPFYWMLRGRCQYGLAQYREAEASFSAVLSLADGVDSARMGRGYALLRRGKFTEAESDFSEVLRRGPEFTDGYVQRAEARQRLGRDQDALADLNRAIELKPDSSRIRLMRMKLLRTLERTAEADQDFDFVMQNDPMTVEDWHSRAVARLPGNPEEALKDLQAAEKLFGSVPLILQTMAHVLSERLHRESDSIAVLDRILEQNPRYQHALSGRAVLNARAGNRDRAKGDVETLLKLPEPRTAQINYQIACALAMVSEDQVDIQQQALVWLARAVAGGYGGDLLDTDPDLQPIRQLSDFQMIRRTAKILAGRNRSS
jgi:tetratricopeptide (TPR) repeat protein